MARGDPPGGLPLGFDFAWNDLACDAVGVGLGALVETIATRRSRRVDDIRRP